MRKTLFCYIKMTLVFAYNHFWSKGVTAEGGGERYAG